MVGFQDDLVAETRAGRLCKIATVKERMTPTDCKVLDIAMEDRDRMPTQVILRALNKNSNGFVIGQKAILKHRDHMCSCFNEVSL